MADINIERKRPSVWPWIVGLVVLALLIWALTELFGRNDVERLEPGVTGMAPPAQLDAPAPRAA